MYKLLVSLTLSLYLASCATVKMPDPTIQVPKAPAELMQPAERLQTINENDTKRNLPN